VPGFEASTTVQVLLPCSHDLASAASKYLHGLESGDVPVTLQLSGSVFYATSAGLQIMQLPWDREASCRLPLALWRAVIDQHFPNCSVLPVRHELLAQLERYRASHGLRDCEHALETLLATSQPAGHA